MATEILPGTVFAVRTGSGFTSRMIRLGAALLDKPNMVNHVAVMHHYTDGVPWGLEGRPGGVGWVDMRRYLKSPYTVDNREQPTNDVFKANIAKWSQEMLGAKYDWEAIASDTLASLRFRDIFKENWKGKGVPGHVVCSSYAAYLYSLSGLPHPGEGVERYCTPADWADFIIKKGWK